MFSPLIIINMLLKIIGLVFCAIGIYIAYGTEAVHYGPIVFIIGVLLFRRVKLEEK